MGTSPHSSATPASWRAVQMSTASSRALPPKQTTEHWTDAQLIPYIDTALQAFGPNRLLYGSDWPVCLLATSLSRWIGVLDQALAGCPPADKRKILRDNANTLYRLGMD